MIKMSYFTSGDILSHRWRCLISQVPQTSLSTFCVLGTGDTKSQADPIPSEAQGSVGGTDVCWSGSLRLSRAHCVPLFPRDQ